MTDPDDASPPAFADLVESLRRPTGPTRGSEWRGVESVVTPPSLDEKLRRFARLHQRRAIRPSRMPFARRAPALLLEGTTRAQEVHVVETLVRRLERRLYSFDLRDFTADDLPAFLAALAPLADERTALVHLRGIEHAPFPDALRSAVAAAPAGIAVIATVVDATALDPSLSRAFSLKLSWAAEARSPHARVSGEVPQTN